jgi:fatty acid elongase 3
MLISFLGIWSCATAMWWPILLNTFVHIVMYFYYTLVILGQKVSWKNHLTLLQLTQFALDLALFAYWIFYNVFYLFPVGKQCSGDFYFGCFACFVVFSFLILFSRLYLKNLAKDAKNAKKKE